MGRKIYSPELKERIISLVEQGRPIAQLAREYEPTEQTIHKWMKVLYFRLDSVRFFRLFRSDLDL